ncbi:hypothetical protein AK830_g4747 [Neonectria ditissima]|uniref:Uncharacterized protein n=1 Tax=Neonectria ditissima TaxID=78410 RepID=A0A0P7BMG2_9HYPO|nr:hypothetical protein AK830_g4747 [Neonectria ditissima]
MPVTLAIADHPAKPWDYFKVTTPEAFFEEASPHNFSRCRGIIQSSVPSSKLEANYTSPSKNGFVWAAYHAYSNSHHLTIRPDDIWLSIITQISSYVNAYAETPSAYFVEHEEQKREVVIAKSLDNVDSGTLAERMKHMIAEKVKDAELRTWVMPEFSTTSDTDRVVASVLFMGTSHEFSSPSMGLTCGIPSVTLLGEVADYKNIQARLDKLDEMGEEPGLFADMLRPILRYMIMSFEDPTNPKVVSFWNKIVTRHELSGWGKSFHTQNKVLDGVEYPQVEVREVPSGFNTIPVMIDDNGKTTQCIILAGSLGIQALPEDTTEEPSGGEASEGNQTALTRVRPLAGWIVFKEGYPPPTHS